MRATNRLFTVLFTTFAVALQPAAATAQEPTRWSLRAQVLAADYSQTGVVSTLSGRSYLDLSADLGFQVGVELRPGRRVGWELSMGELPLDATLRLGRLIPESFDPLVLREEITVIDTGTLGLRPILLALLIHPVSNRPVDFYVGPTLGWTFFRVDVDLGERDPELTYGGKLGAGVRIRNTAWSAGVEIRHLEILREDLERDLYRDIRLTTAAAGLTWHLGGRGSSR